MDYSWENYTYGNACKTVDVLRLNYVLSMTSGNFNWVTNIFNGYALTFGWMNNNCVNIVHQLCYYFCWVVHSIIHELSLKLSRNRLYFDLQLKKINLFKYPIDLLDALHNFCSFVLSKKPTNLIDRAMKCWL